MVPRVLLTQLFPGKVVKAPGLYQVWMDRGPRTQAVHPWRTTLCHGSYLMPAIVKYTVKDCFPHGKG